MQDSTTAWAVGVSGAMEQERAQEQDVPAGSRTRVKGVERDSTQVTIRKHSVAVRAGNDLQRARVGKGRVEVNAHGEQSCQCLAGRLGIGDAVADGAGLEWSRRDGHETILVTGNSPVGVVMLVEKYGVDREGFAVELTLDQVGHARRLQLGAESRPRPQ